MSSVLLSLGKLILLFFVIVVDGRQPLLDVLLIDVVGFAKIFQAAESIA